jgi:hypothetical protein
LEQGGYLEILQSTHDAKSSIVHGAGRFPTNAVTTVKRKECATTRARMIRKSVVNVITRK